MNTNDPDKTSTAEGLAAIDFHSPGRFKIRHTTLLSTHSEPWSPSPLLLDTTSPEAQLFTSMDEVRQHTLALIEQARRNICIYSQDLEPGLYDHHCVQQACSRFLRAHPSNRLFLLVNDTARAVSQGHSLIRLARRLTSNMHVRKKHPDLPSLAGVFLIVDDCGLLLRTQPEQFTGRALYNSPGRARQLRRAFDSAWDHSLPDPNLRSFLL